MTHLKISATPRRLGTALAALTVAVPAVLAAIAIPADALAVVALVLPFIATSVLEGRLPHGTPSAA